MEVTLRPRITAGVGIAGASIIAVTPVTGPLPDIQVPAGAALRSRTDSFGTADNTVGALLNPIGAGRSFY